MDFVFTVHTSYFTDGDISDEYRVSVRFINKTAGRTYSASWEDYIVVARLAYRRTTLYPSRRLLKNDTDIACDWMTSFLASGDGFVTECQAAIGFASAATFGLRAEAYLPPDHVIESAEITVKFPYGMTKFCICQLTVQNIIFFLK